MLTFNAWGGAATGASGRTSPMALVRIVDPDGNEVPPGDVGEIVARGPTVMNGYLHRPDLNAERLAGEWHHTNDLGRREADGSLTWIGPKTRLIKSAAENIYPAEVEGALQKHPAVQEAAVIGVADKTWGQSVKAIVVLREGRGDRGRPDRALQVAHCVLQEAQGGRVHRQAAPRRIRHRLRRPRRPLRGRGLPHLGEGLAQGGARYCVPPMANILEFLRGLLTSGDEQQRFAGNPHGYLTAHGFDDLSGEDVAEAIRVVARTLPSDVAERLSPFQRTTPTDCRPVRPQIGESELDAAVRQLQFAVSIKPRRRPASRRGAPSSNPNRSEPMTEPEARRAGTGALLVRTSLRS